ncbi:MAG: apolipoprotein N-acyltransferase [Candidatus Omnitrophota bacterium]|jgi:apolipoprotein N-acyltransferase
MSFLILKKIAFGIILVLISAVFLIVSFLPNANLELFAWFAFVPLFFTLQNKTKAKAFLISYLAGIIFWLGTIYWLIHVTFVGLIILVIYLALYFGFFGLAVSLIRPRHNALTGSLIIACLWVGLEYLRSHLFTGFSWALLGYSQYLNLPIIQIAKITGVWGVSFLVMSINLWIYLMLNARFAPLDKKQKFALPIIGYALVLVLLSISLGYGFYELYSKSQLTNQQTIRISVIQGNIPQAIKWEKSARGGILGEYQRLSRLAAADSPDLVIWPEAALPGIMEQDIYLKRTLQEFVSNIGIPFLVGIVNLDDHNYYNSATLISQQGEFMQRYDKLHLVPFGEYIPLKRIFGFLETVVPIGDFSPGKEYAVFNLDKSMSVSLSPSSNLADWHLVRPEFGVLICFEDIFPQLSRNFVRKGADFLVNITNDAWFGDTSSPYQHLSASVFRAVENGVYLVRAANTGISGFITPEGRIYPLINKAAGKQTFISGYLTQEITIFPKKNSLYTQWGDWFVLVCLVVVMCGVYLANSRYQQ